MAGIVLLTLSSLTFLAAYPSNASKESNLGYSCLISSSHCQAVRKQILRMHIARAMFAGSAPPRTATSPWNTRTDMQMAITRIKKRVLWIGRATGHGKE